ncbi:MAG: SGNH/GDSL hydrolase family protein [Verrucomicrobiaceae bacterium]|nr:SGNH/GDSL hydrolase family protein [Verrucomicrobiaceae bacterium]
MITRLLAALAIVTSSGLQVAAESTVLPPNARIAIIGDSITEQKLYSKFIETYLLACAGRTDVECWQFGMSGEMAIGIVSRSDIDLNLFNPTVATLCYGMNDGMYQPYNPSIGTNFENSMRRVLEKLPSLGVRQVIVGSPGVVDSHFFQRFPAAEYNNTLGQLAKSCRKLAAEFKQPFADVHTPMLQAMEAAKKTLGDSYDVAGEDGIHPGPNGHVIMAQAFLKTLGMKGEIGTIEVDLQGSSRATDGHVILAASEGQIDIESSRWPFCFDPEAMSILPFCTFSEDLNRLTLKVTHLSGSKAKITWGKETREFTNEQLERGINLAAEFAETPFDTPFLNLMDAVAQKQAFETHAFWNMAYTFRGKNLDPSKAETKAAYKELKQKVNEGRRPLLEAARALFKPVKHTLIIVPAP